MKTTLALLATVLAPAAWAQPGAANTGPVGMVEQPCPPAVAMPASVQKQLYSMFMEPRTLVPADFTQLTGDKAFAEYNAAARGSPARDWPNLCRFRAANAAVVASGAAPQLVFMGDSITENWLLGDPSLFNNNYINRGISAQTTPHMVLRFRADVVALKPRFVHLMAGTNDIAGNTGPSTVQDFKNNVMTMAELAKANGIGVLLASIPPAASFNWQPSIDPVPRIRELNAWLKSYAAANGHRYVDYYTALSGPKGELRSELSNDGVHPNRDGYVIMRKVLETQMAAPAK